MCVFGHLCVQGTGALKNQIIPWIRAAPAAASASPHPRIHPQKQGQEFLRLLLLLHPPGGWIRPHLSRNTNPPSHRSHLNPPFPLKKLPGLFPSPILPLLSIYLHKVPSGSQSGREGAASDPFPGNGAGISSSPRPLGKLRELFLEEAFDSLGGLWQWRGECVESGGQQSLPCTHPELLGHFPKSPPWMGRLEGCKGLVGGKNGQVLSRISVPSPEFRKGEVWIFYQDG